MILKAVHCWLFQELRQEYEVVDEGTEGKESQHDAWYQDLREETISQAWEQPKYESELINTSFHSSEAYCFNDL